MANTKPIEFHFIQSASNAVLDDCIALLNKDAKRPIRTLTKSSDVIKTHKEAEKFVLVYHLDQLKKLKDLLRVVNYLKINKPEGNFLICVAGTIQHPKLQEIFQKMGCADYIVLNQAPRAVRIKLNRLSERLEFNKDSLFGGQGAGERTAKSGKVTRVGSIEIPHDYWIYPKWSVFKKIMGHWIFELRGPSPNVGRWLESDMEGEWHDGCFWWTPHDLDYSLFKGQVGSWVYKSKVFPEFKEPHWTFVGQEPQLIYLDPVQKLPRYKIKTTSDGNLEVAANSKMGEDLLPLIQKTFEYEIRITNTNRPGSLIGVRTLSNEGTTPIVALTLSQQEVRELDIIMDELKNVTLLEATEKETSGFFNSDGVDSNPVFGFEKAPAPEPDVEITFSKDIFKKVEDRKIQESYLNEAEKKFKTSTIWTRGKKNIVGVKSTVFDQKNKKITFNMIPSPDLTDLFESINEQTIPSIYFNVSLPRTAVFLNMSTKDLTVTGYSIIYSFKDEMWQVQRRKNFRYEFLAHDQKNTKQIISQSAKLSFESKIKPYQLADISAGGIRVIIPVDEINQWKKGLKIESIELFVNGKTIQTQAITKWVKKLETPYSPGNHQVGLEFINLSQYNQKWISDQIISELNDYFKTFPILET
ncbi:MAG: PilZ domain-containing protein [Xanthomonadaceae bacterium]|nr:PilZ domain-containing protein [Xanthomonadaceae bacterium]